MEVRNGCKSLKGKRTVVLVIILLHSGDDRLQQQNSIYRGRVKEESEHARGNNICMDETLLGKEALPLMSAILFLYKIEHSSFQ